MNLTRPQLAALWIAVALIVVAAAYPPWERVGAGSPADFYPLLAPPKGGIRVDLSRLLIEWFAIATVGAAAIVTLRPRP